MGADAPCWCGCSQPRHASVHAIARLLAGDDLDAALGLARLYLRQRRPAEANEMQQQLIERKEKAQKRIAGTREVRPVHVVDIN